MIHENELSLLYTYIAFFNEKSPRILLLTWTTNWVLVECLACATEKAGKEAFLSISFKQSIMGKGSTLEALHNGCGSGTTYLLSILMLCFPRLGSWSILGSWNIGKLLSFVAKHIFVFNCPMYVLLCWSGAAMSRAAVPRLFACMTPFWNTLIPATLCAASAEPQQKYVLCKTVSFTQRDLAPRVADL